MRIFVATSATACLMFFYMGHARAQSLTVANGAEITIANTGALHFEELSIMPSQSFSILGSQELTEVNNSINSTGIEKYYNLTSLINGFTGTIVFYYFDEELNGIDENDLVLELKDETDTWQVFVPTIDSANNSLTYTFTTPISFTQITASDTNNTLEVAQIEADFSLVAFPNPTLDKVHLQSSQTIEKVQVYDTNGRHIDTLHHTTVINLSLYQNGLYLLKVLDENNHLTILKILKK